MSELCIAKLSPVPTQCWAEVALVPIDPAAHPPATHPQEKLIQAFDISQTMSRQCLLSRQCLDIVWTVSGQYLDSVRTVSRHCVYSFWKVFDPPAGKVKTSLGNKSNYVKTVCAQCLNSIRTVSGQCPDSCRTLSRRCFWTSSVHLDWD